MTREHGQPGVGEVPMPKVAIAAEPVIRLSAFLGMLVLMALWEFLTPRRPQAVGRGIRWPNNLGLVVLDTLILRLMFPLAGVGMAFRAQGNNWGLFNLIPLPVWVAIPAAVLPACRRHATNRTGRAQRTSSHTTQETPPALPHGCAVYLVSEVDKPGLLRSIDA
jgi:hypothetical protein